MGSRLQAGKQANYLWYPMARFSRSMNLYQIILFMVCGLYPLHPGTTHLSKGFICTYAWPLQQPALYQAAESRSGAVNKGSGASAQAPPRYSHWDSHDVMRRKHEKTHKKRTKKIKKRTKWTEVEKKNSRASLLFCGYSQPIWFCPKSSYANYSYKQLRLDSPLKSVKQHY